MIRILAIDDNDIILNSLKTIIKAAFPDSVLDTAINGVKGIELATANDPDVIFLDIMMPGMDGFEVCRHLKQNERSRDIPVVFLTALKGDKENRLKALNAGAEGFLTKPIDDTELIAQIRVMVKIKIANKLHNNEQERLVLLVAKRTRELEQEKKETLKLLANLKTENELRRETEEELRGSEELFRNIFEYHTAVKLIIDPGTGNIIDANHAAESFYGWPKEQLKQMKIQDFNTASDKKVKQAMGKAKMKEENRFEFCHRLADGSIRNVEVDNPD